jgi:hypothetical protein
LRDGSAEVPWTINIKVFVMQAAAAPRGRFASPQPEWSDPPNAGHDNGGAIRNEGIAPPSWSTGLAP